MVWNESNSRRVAIRGGFVLAFLLSLMATAAAQPSSPLAEKSVNAAEIVGVARQQGFARVIVQFESPLVPGQTTTDPAGIANARSRIAAVQDAIIERHFGSSAHPQQGPGFNRGITRFQITPGFAVNVTVQELEALAANPLVKSIQLDRLEPPTLIDSVPLIGIPAAYGDGATGQGQAVVVIDTGIQANHEFLSGKVIAEACFSNGGGSGSGVSLCPNGQPTQTGAKSADAETNQCV